LRIRPICLTAAVSVLVTPLDLQDLRRDPTTVVIDVQYTLGGPPGREDYDRAHIPGAHFVDLEAELSGAPGPGGRHPLPTAHSVQEALRRCGVDAGSTVVAYDAKTSLAAARAWWVFRYFGLADVRVLDGGLERWRAEGLPTTTEYPTPGQGTFTARPGGLPMLEAEGAAEVAHTGILLDSRAPERFRGESEPIDRVAGHIPGAVNAPMADYLRPDGRFLPVGQLRDYFAGKGVFEASSVGTSCGSGVTAAHEALALHEIGVQASVYVGSWSEWITDPSRPIALGEA
jgi:thiosulfate/3-mercaptopyruvate sulfurtransferase